MQRTLQRWLTDTSTKEYFIVSDVLAFFTVLSIISIVLETVPSLEEYNTWFLLIEWVAVAVFSFEYIGRILVTKPSTKYIFSFFGLVDLISILPTFLGLGNFTFLKSARALRLIRLLRMVRIAKMKHVRTDEIEERMGFFMINILLFLTVLIGAMLLVGTLMYLAEGGRATFTSIPAGMWWSLKVFIMGIPITTPETAAGDAVHVFARLIGLTVFGVLIGVVGNVLKKVLFGKTTQG